MKITRRQLNNIIKEELQLNEVIPVAMLAAAGITALITKYGLALGALSAGIATNVFLGKAMSEEAKKVYDNPEFAEMREILDTLKVAAEKLPDAAKKGVVDSATKTINSFLEDLMIKAEKDGPAEEPGESELDARDNVDPGESPVFADDIEADQGI